MTLVLMNGPGRSKSWRPRADAAGWLVARRFACPVLGTAAAPNCLWFKRFGRCADDGASGGDGFATPHRAGCCVEHPCISSITRYRVPSGGGLRMSLAREEHSAGNQSSRHDDRGGVVHGQPLVFVLLTTLRASGINFADRDYTDGYAKGTIVGIFTSEPRTGWRHLWRALLARGNSMWQLPQKYASVKAVGQPS